MLTKANFPILNSAYICSTNARMANPHPSPTDLYQAILLLSKAKITRNKYSNAQGNVSPIAQAIQTLSWLNHAPWSNGNISPLNFHPLISLGKYVYQNSSNVEYFINKLQTHMQTRIFFESEENWVAAFKTYEQNFDNFFKKIKNVSGFELQEFTLECSSIQSDTVQFDNLIRLIDEKSSVLLHLSEPENFLAIFLKKEPCLNQRMKIRLIVVLQKDFIDDPCGFSDSNFFESLKHTVESSSCHTLKHEELCLNGFLKINRFNKKSQHFKEQMKWLKGYLIGTDILYRMNELLPTFQIIYSKFD